MLLSIDDGCASDLRVVELCQKYEVEAIFYWPIEWRSLAYEKGYKPLSYKQACYIARHFEIGAHSITHRWLTSLPFEEAAQEIMESKTMLERLFRTKVTKFCPPRGYTNEGLTSYTNLIYNSQRLTRGEGLVHIHPNSGANNNMHWLDYVEHIGLDNVQEGWLHSWELDKYPQEWDNLEKFLRRVYEQAGD